MNTKKEEKAETLFSCSQTFQQYVDERWNLQRLGPYDYMAFCKKMKIPEFIESVKKEYNQENKIKNQDIENGF